MMRAMKVIGVDIGGSKIRAVRWNGTRVEKLAVAKTPRSVEGLTRTLGRVVAKLENGERLAVGMGFAGSVGSGVVASSRNNRFIKNYSPSRSLARPVRVDNDARTFARAEYTLGAAKGFSRALFFTFGTGIGRAYGVAGTVKRVERFELPEKWEWRYQRVKGAPALALFLAEHLMPIVRSYKPRVVVAGGGVTEKSGFMALFRRALRQEGFNGEVRGSKLGTLAGSIGAAMLVQ
jgi:predicted NBD/HSP70 family sugar kinase